MKLARLETAGFAPIACDAAGMAVDELLHQLNVAALLGGRSQHGGFKQLVETEQGRIASQLLANELIGRLWPLALELPMEKLVEQVERRVRRNPGTQQLVPLLDTPESAIGVHHALRDESEIHRVLVLDPLPRFERIFVTPLRGEQITEETARTHTAPIDLEGALEVRLRLVVARIGHRACRELAVKIGHLGTPHHPLVLGQGLRDLDRLGPVLLLLIDLEQIAQRDVVRPRATQALECSLGSVEQARLQKVLTELTERLQALVLAEVLAIDEREFDRLCSAATRRSSRSTSSW